MIQYSISFLKLRLAICSLPPDAEIPIWADRGDLISLIRTSHELTVICEEDRIPLEIVKDSGWRAFYIDAALDFDLVGVLLSVINPLAEAGISIFALSTYETDYILVRDEYTEIAKQVLKKAGFRINVID